MTIIWTSRLPAVLAALVLAAVTWALPDTAQAAPAPPQLSIAVDDGHPSAVSSDTLTYTVEVTNLGTKRVKDLIITQSVPDGAAIRSTDPGSTSRGRTVTWSVDLGPGKKATRKATVAVEEHLPDGLLRLATVACARTTAKAPPVVCASDSDQLPAGAAAEAQRQEPQPPAVGDQGWWPWPGAVVLGSLVLAVLVAVLLLLRHRGRKPVEPAQAVVDPTELASSPHR